MYGEPVILPISRDHVLSHGWPRLAARLQVLVQRENEP